MIEYQEASVDGETDVEMHRWSDVAAPSIIGTTGLSGCIGIAVLNDSTARAWVLHAPNMQHGEEGLRSMLCDVRDASAQSDVLRVVLAGGKDDDPVVRAEIEKDRAVTRIVLAEILPLATVVEAWGLEDFFVEYEEEAWRETQGCPHFNP